MGNTVVHEHPGVYSSYDASSVIGGKKTARILGAAAVSTTGTANEVVTLTSYAEGVSAFGEDAEGTVGMAALLAALYRNGAAVVKALFHGSLRVDEADEALGLDASQHGESAYPSFSGLD